MKVLRTVWSGGKGGDIPSQGITMFMPCGGISSTIIVKKWAIEEKIISKPYLSLSGAKSQGMKQLMAGGGVALVAEMLIDSLKGLF